MKKFQMSEVKEDLIMSTTDVINQLPSENAEKAWAILREIVFERSASIRQAAKETPSLVNHNNLEVGSLPK